MKQSATRQRIVETATELFYQKGYNLTGINEIIAEAGIAKATLYSHFSSKEEICIAYLQHRNQSFLEDIKAFIEEKSEGKNQVLAIVEYLLPFFEDERFNGCWCIRTIAEIPKDNVAIREEIQFQKNVFLDFIREVVKRNFSNLSEDESERLSKRTYMIYEGSLSESHLHQKAWPIHEGIDLLNMILP